MTGDASRAAYYWLQNKRDSRRQVEIERRYTACISVAPEGCILWLLGNGHSFMMGGHSPGGGCFGAPFIVCSASDSAMMAQPLTAPALPFLEPRSLDARPASPARAIALTRTQKTEQDCFCGSSIRQVGLDLAGTGLERAELFGVQQRVFQDVRARGWLACGFHKEGREKSGPCPLLTTNRESRADAP